METYADIYINFALSSFGKIEMTKLSKILDGKYSHDVFTKNLLLNDEIETDKALWNRVKSILRDYENEDDGCQLHSDKLNSLKTKNAKLLATQILDFIQEQQKVCKEDERLLHSSEILESLFGKFKFLEKEQSKSSFTNLLFKLKKRTS